MPATFVVVENPAHRGMRVDRYVSEVLALCSRSQIQVRNLTAAVNGAPAKLSRRLCLGDRLTLEYQDPEPTTVMPEPMSLTILYEDDRVVVVDKPVGVVVHPAKGNYSGTLIQGIMHHLGAESAFGASVRPGVVHRLDKDTSGVMIVAKDPTTQAYLADQFKKRTTHKRYLAVVKGSLHPARGRVEGFMARDPHNRKRFHLNAGGGKWSESEYHVMSWLGGYSFVSLRPQTGRTHQLRVHMQSIGHPILGDPVYARKDAEFVGVDMMLHAYRLEILVPPTGEPRVFRAPLPDRFKETLRILASRTPS